MERVVVQVVFEGIAETMAVRMDQTTDEVIRSFVALRGLDAATRRIHTLDI